MRKLTQALEPYTADVLACARDAEDRDRQVRLGFEFVVFLVLVYTPSDHPRAHISLTPTPPTGHVHGPVPLGAARALR